MTVKPSYVELEQKIQQLEAHIIEFKLKEESFNKIRFETDTLFNKSPLTMFIVDADRRVCKLNEAASKMSHQVEEANIGLPAGEVLRCVNTLKHPKGCGYSDACDACMIRSTIINTFQTGNDHSGVEASISFFTTKGTSVSHVLISTNLLSLTNHKRVLVCLNDITEIKQAEIKIRQNEKNYRSIFKNNHAVMLLIDPEDGNIIDANPAAIAFYGWSLEEITTKKIADINLLNEAQILQEMKKACSGHQKRFTFLHRHANGSIHDVEICSGPIEINNKQLLLSIIFDITDRKLAEKKFKESEQTARALINASTESVFLIKKDGTFIDMNEVTANRLGKDINVLIGKNAFDMLPAEVAKSRRPILENVIHKKQPILIQDEHQGFVLETHLYPVIDSDGDVSRIAVYSKDITTQEENKKNLIASRKELLLKNQIANILLSFDGKEMYSKILHLILKEFKSKYGLFGYIDENGDFICPSLTSDVWEQCTVTGKNFIFPKSHWGGLWGQSLKNKKLLFTNDALNPPKGHVPLSRALACPIIYDSELIGLLSLANKDSDYTDEDLAKIESIALYTAPILHARLEGEKDAQKRKEAEQLLRESEEKFTKAFHCNPAMAGLADLESGKYIEVNQTFYDKLGFTPEEVIGKRASEVVRMDFKFRDRVLADLKNHRQIRNEEAQIYSKNGASIDVILYAQIIELQGVNYNFTSALDVSELKQVEKSLRIQRDNLINVYESIKDGIYIVDQQKNIEFVNQSLIKEFGPYQGKKCYDYFYGWDEPCSECIIAEATTGESVRRELFLPKNQRYYDSIDTPLLNADGSVSKLQILRDITDRKQAEEAIKVSLKEKETLLQEIHHRVKNNLTVVASLLNLQANNMKDDRLKTALLDSKSRVQAMSAIHETLYQSENLALIDMKVYLTKLAAEVTRNYLTGTDDVKLKIASENISIGANQASPIGLIVNELITNSLKYGFVNIENGEINITLQKKEDQIELEYTDNGIGMPEALNWKSFNTLGLKLVHNLVENQLDGSIDMKSEKGVKFTIKFNIET